MGPSNGLRDIAPVPTIREAPTLYGVQTTALAMSVYFIADDQGARHGRALWRSDWDDVRERTS
jgi:hypothetical protein